MQARTLVATIAVLLAFAANSVFCRMALSSGSIDPLTFSPIRFASGAAGDQRVFERDRSLRVVKAFALMCQVDPKQS